MLDLFSRKSRAICRKTRKAQGKSNYFTLLHSRYSMKMSHLRLPLILLGVLAAVQPGISQQPKAQPLVTSLVTSDVAPLRSVVVLGPADDLLSSTYSYYTDQPFGGPIYVDGAETQHASLVELLRAGGVRTLNVTDLMESAIRNARKQGMLEQAVAEIFPEQAPRLKSRLDQLTASDLLGRSPELFYEHNRDKGYLDPLIPQSPAFFYTRDFAVSTPAGLILTNSRMRHRKYEHRLGRFIFRYADEFKAVPVAFDAEAEGVHCEGGDIIVKDAHTILMGIENFSDREAAQKIAQKLHMDVIGVNMPPISSFSGVNIEIMHLDTVFNLVDKDKVLTVPYFFLSKYDKDNPVTRLLKAANDQPHAKAEKGELEFPSSLNVALESIPKVGWLVRFEAGTGNATEMGKKLGDYVLEQGYHIIPVGGEQGALSEEQYINERVLYELSLQAANVVQLGPGRVIAYAHNKFTNAAMQQAGIKVETFEGKYLADMGGGPHCLTMPLQRGASPGQ